MSLEDIGDKFNLTRERVRQIKDKAITKLRTNSRTPELKGYLGKIKYYRIDIEQYTAELDYTD